MLNIVGHAEHCEPCQATIKIIKVRLIVSILTTIIVGIVSCLMIAAYISTTEKDSGIFFYAFIMILGNVILPVFLIVCSYAFLKRKIRITNRMGKYFTQAGLIILLSAFGLCLMTVSKVVSYYSGFSGLTFQNLKESFDSSYRGYLPEVILYSLMTPIVYFLIETKFTKSTNKETF